MPNSINGADESCENFYVTAAYAFLPSHSAKLKKGPLNRNFSHHLQFTWGKRNALEKLLHPLLLREGKEELGAVVKMVLWEITLGTAYFLGLKRTYKLALKIQRKLISPKHPKVRQFVQRRTRSIFDMALKVHLKIQERDIEVGRNFGNWILRKLDRYKPEAQIRGPPPPGINAGTNLTKHSTNSSHLNSQCGPTKHNAKNIDGKSDRHMFTAARNVWSKPFPTIAMIMRPSGHNTQYRQYVAGRSELFTVDHGRFGHGEVIRNDIRQWIMHQ